MLARRFSCPPVQEALYDLRDVPEAERDMRNTLILRPSRDDWLALLGELVQLTNEAVRRRAASPRDASKPLLLEYMADRMDIDDPLFGYLAVEKNKGWIQGFVTCTTFTTWHRGFRWDSLDPCLDLAASPHDEDENGTQGSGGSTVAPERNCGGSHGHGGGRAIDSDGSLSTEMMTEVFAGDPDNEGVVWPRVAEISLLGALGCGRWLLQLVIDGLEVRASPYRYVTLMATHNAIPFYERMGFVRVGAVQAMPRATDNDEADESHSPSKGSLAGKKRKAAAGGGGTVSGEARGAARGMVCSRHRVHVCAAGETCAALARRYEVDVFDILFLNQRAFPSLHQHQPVAEGTSMLVPQAPTVAEARAQAAATRQVWHVVIEEASLAQLGALTSVPATTLLHLNRGRITGLQLTSVLRCGTRVLIGGDAEHDYDAYCHWTFPDDNAREEEPSYMMVRRLKPHSERRDGGVRETQGGGAAASDAADALEQAKRMLVHARPQVVPAPARQAIFDKIRARRRASDAADAAAPADANAAATVAASAASVAPPPPPPAALFNRVVRIEGEEGYWYVLTYLPDLQWCHVAPLTTRGVFKGTRSASDGRPKWMLLSEEEGGEMDVGAARCIIMRAKEMQNTPENADLEEWDILGEEEEPR